MDNQMSDVVELTKQLVSCPSITPLDAGCQNIVAGFLSNLGFSIEYLNYGDVKNIWAQKGDSGPLLLLLGHIDVVPTGNLEDWKFDPFTPTIEDGYLYGRGVADMKGGVAALLVACENFIKKVPNFGGTLAVLITSDEEGPAKNGTARVVEYLKQQQKKIDYCLVAEPTAKEKIGDGIKIGRRGSITGVLNIYGIQGHVAHPHRAVNPIHKFIPFVHELLKIEWDKGNQYFPATSLQISNIFSGTGACNVIPSELKCIFNLRYSNELSAENIMDRITNLANEYGLEYTIAWDQNGYPFLSNSGELLQAVKQSIYDITGLEPAVTTDGGTSDARFVISTGAQIVELGLCNTNIHGVNESTRVEDLKTLTTIYEQIFELILKE